MRAERRVLWTPTLDVFFFIVSQSFSALSLIHCLFWVHHFHFIDALLYILSISPIRLPLPSAMYYNMENRVALICTFFSPFGGLTRAFRGWAWVCGVGDVL